MFGKKSSFNIANKHIFSKIFQKSSSPLFKISQYKHSFQTLSCPISRNFSSNSVPPYERKPIKLLRAYEFIEQLDYPESFSRYSLAELKENVLAIRPSWLEDDKVREFFRNLYDQHFVRLLKQTWEIFEFEKFLFLFSWGQVYLDDSAKELVWRRFNDLLDQDLETEFNSTIIYNYSKCFNYLLLMHHFNPQEIKDVLSKLESMISGSAISDDFYLMRSLVFILQSMLVFQDPSPLRESFLAFFSLLERGNIGNEKVANIIFFTLENSLILLKEYPEIVQKIERCRAKIPQKEYVRSLMEESNTQRKIANILINLGFMVYQNEIVGTYSVDFFLKPKLILEYHGTPHYYVNRREMILSDQVKIRALRKMGYRVQVIPHFQWHLLESRERQEAYLNEIIYDSFYETENK